MPRRSTVIPGTGARSETARTTRRRFVRWPIGCLLLVSALAAGFTPGTAPLGVVDAAAPVRQPAPTGPTTVIVGDSLTGGNTSYIGPTLRNAGLDVRLEALSARRIATSFYFRGARDSGVARVRSLRAAGVEPDLWVIQLGTNDLGVVKNCRCPDPIAFAGDIIDQLLAEIGPGRPIAWVTVLNRNDAVATRWFNHALSVRAASNPYIALIDWERLAVGRPDWFLDAVHPNVSGVRVFTQMYVDQIRELLADPLGPADPVPGLQRATRLGPPADG